MTHVTLSASHFNLDDIESENEKENDVLNRGRGRAASRPRPPPEPVDDEEAEEEYDDLEDPENQVEEEQTADDDEKKRKHYLIQTFMGFKSALSHLFPKNFFKNSYKDYDVMSMEDLDYFNKEVDTYLNLQVLGTFKNTYNTVIGVVEKFGPQFGVKTQGLSKELQVKNAISANRDALGDALTILEIRNSPFQMGPLTFIALSTFSAIHRVHKYNEARENGVPPDLEPFEDADEDLVSEYTH